VRSALVYWIHGCFKDVLTRRGHGKACFEPAISAQDDGARYETLDWDTFVERTAAQSGRPGLKSEKAIVLIIKGAFNTLEELTDCMHAFLLPGIA
jgi:hypothetical protein